MSKVKFKQKIDELRSNEWKVPQGYDLDKLIDEIMDHIGDIESEIREDYVYTPLAHLITKAKVFSPEQLKKILNTALSHKCLFYKITEAGNDTIFTRTFSLLAISLVLYYHNTNVEKLLTKEEMINVHHQIIRYAKEEKDLRGYIPIKGWAHAVAHIADALEELSASKHIEQLGNMQSLQTIQNLLSVNYYTYINDEDERLVNVIMRMLDELAIKEEQIIEWIESFEDVIDYSKYVDKRHTNINVRMFLRSLYFRLMREKKYENLINAIYKFIEAKAVFK